MESKLDSEMHEFMQKLAYVVRPDHFYEHDPVCWCERSDARMVGFSHDFVVLLRSEGPPNEVIELDSLLDNRQSAEKLAS